MTLLGYNPVSEAATIAGAPIDTLQATAFRRNDVLFEQIVQALMCSPFMPTMALEKEDEKNNVLVDSTNANDVTRRFINAKTINVTVKCSLTPRVPLIWIAQERITISAEIDAAGKGAPSGQKGDFGGSGGGGVGLGFDCMMPFSTTERVLNGGAIGIVGNPLSSADLWKLSRALLYLPFLVGGASGADLGGAGGGVVCLCAPVIEIKTGGKINVSGENGVNKGGGGGGFIYLVARELINVVDGTTAVFTGGTATGSGKAGGNGLCVRHEFQ